MPGHLRVAAAIRTAYCTTASSSVTCAVPRCMATMSPSASTCLTCDRRSEEHTSELQSLMRISYAVFCLKKKNAQRKVRHPTNHLPEHVESHELILYEISVKQ